MTVKQHTNHTWQSWRHHYISNSSLINAIIRRIRRLEKEAAAKKNQTPSDGHTLPNDNHREQCEIHKLEKEAAAKKNRLPSDGHTPTDDADQEPRESSTEIVIQRSPMTRKGKEKAACYLLDNDSDSDSPGTESDQADTPQDFVIHRIPTDHHNRSKNYNDVTDLASSNQLGKIHSNPSVQLINVNQTTPLFTPFLQLRTVFIADSNPYRTITIFLNRCRPTRSRNCGSLSLHSLKVTFGCL
jgi:hypothetical protein